MTPETLAARLDARPTGEGRWLGRCPAHDDRSPSLSIGTGNDGRVLLRCMAGCSTESVVAAAGMTMTALMPEGGAVQRTSRSAPARSEPSPKSNRRTGPSFDSVESAIAAARRGKRKRPDGCPGAPLGVESRQFLYHDHDGRHVGTVLRWDAVGDLSKEIRPVSVEDDGRWRIGAMPEPRPLYRLPEVLPADLVLVTEGEKCADVAHEIGLVATCCAGGSKTVDKTDWSPLAGKIVAILPDNDAPGESYANDVAAALARLAPRPTAKIVRLPGLEAKEDVVDFVAKLRDTGGSDDATRDELLRLIESTEPMVAMSSREKSKSAEVLTRPNLIRLADVEPREVSWLWPGRIPLGRLTLLVGVPGLGKSFVTTDWASRVSTGTPWPDGTDCDRGSVLLVSAEDDPADTIRPRLNAHHADADRIHLLQGVVRVSGDGESAGMFSLVDVEPLEEALSEIGDVRLVVVDPIGSYLGRSDSHRDNEVRAVLAPIGLLAERFGCAVLMVAHRRKSGAGGTADESVLGSRAFTGLARSVLHLSPDPKDPSRRLLLPGKNNLGPPAAGLGFRILGEPAAICWDRDPVDMTADEALRAESEPATKSKRPREQAADWLRERLADGAVPYRDLIAEAQDAGLSKRTVERAADELGVEKTKSDFHGGWRWSLPEGCHEEHEGLQIPVWSPSHESGVLGGETELSDGDESWV